MQDRADRDDGIDGGNGAGSADHSALSGDGGVPAGGGEPDADAKQHERAHHESPARKTALECDEVVAIPNPGIHDAHYSVGRSARVPIFDIAPVSRCDLFGGAKGHGR